MTDLREAASGLLEAVVTAIKDGDWKIDGACDPTVEIIRLKNILAKPIKESFNPSTDAKEAFNLDRRCWERGCMAYDTRDCDEGTTVYVDAVNIRVDETAKREHEPWCDSVTKLLLSMPPQIPPCNCKPKREWVGLTEDELNALWVEYHGDNCIADGRVPKYEKAIEAKLKDKNV